MEREGIEGNNRRNERPLLSCRWNLAGRGGGEWGRRRKEIKEGIENKWRVRNIHC